MRAATAAALLAFVTVAAGCGGPEKFETPTYPFSFEYPSGWKTTRSADFVYGAGAGERSISVQYKPPKDQIVVTQYKLPGTVPPGESANQKEIDRIARRLAKQAGGTTSEARPVTFGGIPGYQYIIEYPDGTTTLRNNVTFLFRGNDEFQIICQSSPENRDTVEEGCDQVLSTIKFE